MKKYRNLNLFNRKSKTIQYISPRKIFLLSLLVWFLIIFWLNFGHNKFDYMIFKEYIDTAPVLSVLSFIFLYIIFIVSCLPTLPLNLAAGFFWGGILGGIYSCTGVSIGGLISFTLARMIFGQPLARHFDNRIIDFVKSELERSGWKFLAFIRLNPIMPTGPFNYLLGLTSIKWTTFLWTTFTFLLLPTIFVSYLGRIFNAILSGNDVRLILTKLIVLSAFVTLFFTAKLFFKFINKDT